jgi:hypothetical protein
LRANIERDRRVCFEVDEHEGVFDYGRFECDSGLASRSVCLFGWIQIVDDKEVKQRFCEALMAKYGKPETKRPKGFFPRIDVITVYAITVERMTGKEQSLPPLSERLTHATKSRTHCMCDGALAGSGPCQPMEYERVAYAICEVDLRRHTVRLYWTGRMGLPMHISPLCRALWKLGLAGYCSPPTRACSIPTSSQWAYTWNKAANSCMQTPSPAGAIFT